MRSPTPIRRVLVLGLALTWLGGLSTPTAACAATWFVRQAGSDNADGLSPASAFATIAHALDQIANPGDVVVVGPGTYREGDLGPHRGGSPARPILIEGNSSGSRTGDPAGAVVIQPPEGKSTGFLFLGHSYINLDGFDVREAVDAGIQVRGAGASNVTIRRCHVSDTEKRGIDVATVGAVTIEDCSASDNGSGGISVAGTIPGAGPVTIHNCDVADNADVGILLEAITGAEVTGNRAFRNGLNGIHLRAAVDAVVSENEARSNQDGGIRIDLAAVAVGVSEQFAVTANLVEGNAKSGIAIVGGGPVTVDGNSVLSNGGSGISLESLGIALVPSLRSNRVEGSASNGILMRGTVDALVSANQLTDNHGAAIRVDAGAGTLVDQNIVMTSGSEGVVVGSEGSVGTDAIISKNSLDHTGQVAIAVRDAGDIQVNDNQITASMGGGIFVAAGETRMVAISHNHIATAQGDGVLINGSAQLAIANNEVSATTGGGIYATSAVDVALTTNSVANAGERAIAVTARGAVDARDNQIDGARETGLLLTLGGSPSVVTLAANVVRNAGATGIAVDASNVSPAAPLDDDVPVTLTNNIVEGSATNGITLDEADHAVLDGNASRGNGANGFLLRGLRVASVTNNGAVSNGDGGIVVTADGMLSVRSNRVGANRSTGISLSAEEGGALEIDVRGNDIQSNEDGLFVLAAAGGIVSANTITDNRRDGLGVRSSSALSISANQVLRSGRNGLQIGAPEEPTGDGFSIVGNDVESTGDAGIALVVRGDVEVSENQLLDVGSSGLSVQNAGRARLVAERNHVGKSGAHGLFARGASRGRVYDNVTYSNADGGVTLRGVSRLTVANNLSYANLLDGIALGTGGEGASDCIVVNNTSYGNGGRGLVLGSDAGGYSPRALLLNNLLQNNVGSGIAVDTASADGYIAGFNLNDDGYSDGTRANPYDLQTAAVFVDADGADGVLGGDGANDDDFRLQQVRGGQAQDSAGVDAGSAPVSRIGLTGSTATGDLPDLGTVDVGYHYEAASFAQVDVPKPFMPIYVRAGADSANDGLSPEHAIPGIRAAGLKAVAGMQIVVAPGRYEEPEPIRVVNRSGNVHFLADTSGAFSGVPAGDVVVDAKGGENGFVVVGSDDVTIEGFHVTNSSVAAIQVREGADRARLLGNVVYSNAGRGIEVRSALQALIESNLIYANGTGGVVVQESDGSQVIGNTVYRNGADGILVGGSPIEIGNLGGNPSISSVSILVRSERSPSSLSVGEELELVSDPQVYRIQSVSQPQTGVLAIEIDPPLAKTHVAGELVVSNLLKAPNTEVALNIVAGNGTGILVKLNGRRGYACGGNVSADGYPGNTPRCDSDHLGDPVLADPDGADGVLGGSGYADDNFHLVQATSPAVDIEACGDADPPTGSTRSDGLPDLCPSDAGFHYPAASE